MPIYKGDKKIEKLYRGDTEIARRYRGDTLVYQNRPWYAEYGVLADYVISNGIDNWIDTWLALNTAKDGIIIEMDVEYLTITSAEINAFGAVSGSGSSRNVVEAGSVVNGKSLFYAYSSSGAWTITETNVVPNVRYNLRYELRSGLQIMYVDGVEKYRTTNTANITSTNAMTLFARSYSSVRGGFAHMKWHSFKMSKPDGTPIADYMPLYVSKKPILDQAGNEYPVGSYVLVDNVRKEATVLHGAPLDGYINLESEFYFKSISEQNPYYDLGRRIAYGKRIEIPVSFEDIENFDLYNSFGLFGSRSGTVQNNAYDSFITRNDLPNPLYVNKPDIPLDRKFTIAFEDGKGYIDDKLVTEDTGTVVEYNHNSYLYNINSIVAGGAMSTFRLPIGIRVYGCRIYDVATGILENAYLPQEDQTLKCAITDEVLPKLGINSTDSWEVKHTVWWKDYGNKVDYIESDGTAYIDTGYTLEYENGRTELDVSIVNVDSATSIYGFIERSGNLANRISIGSTASGLFTGSGNTNYMVSPTEANFKYEIDWDRKTGKTILNGVEYDTPNLGGLTKTYSAYLFSRNDNGKPDANGVYDLIGKVYKLKETLDDVVQLNLVPIQTTKSFFSKNGAYHLAGDFIMVNELIELDVPTHIGDFTGEDTLPYRLVSGITFDSGNSYPVIEIGKWSDYNVIIATFTSSDTSNADVFFGTSAATGFMGYADTDNFIVNSNITTDSYTITPTITATEKGDGEKQTIRVLYDSTNDNPFTFGAYIKSGYTKSKISHGMRLSNTDTDLDIVAYPCVLERDFQGYKAGTVGLIDRANYKFYGSKDPAFNFTAVE